MRRIAKIKGQVNFSELKELEKKLNQIESKKWTERILKQLANKLLKKVIRRTPAVGTLHKAWFISNVRKQGDTFLIEVRNPLIYASFVEFGYRKEKGWVRGRYMLTISTRELEQDMPKLLERELRRLFHDISNN